MKIMLSAESKRNLLLFVGASAFALLSAEVIVRVVDPVRPPDRVEYQVDPDLYWQVRPNQSDNRPPATNVNSLGFRSAREVGAKDPARRRVFVIGDSYTWGWGVADDKTYSAQLESLSEGQLEVINGGTPGWGIFQFRAQLERWIEPLAPDYVVVLINTADILRQPYPTEAEEQEFLRRSALRNRIRNLSKLVTVTYRLIERSRLAAQNQAVANAYAMDQQGSVPAGTFARLLDADLARLKDMARIASEGGAKLVLVAWPQEVPMTPAFLSAMSSFAAANGVAYIDLSATLAMYEPKEYSLPNDHHPSEFGNELIARQLLSTISANPSE
jgi:lysophospholipase L1-like esterase